MSLIKYQIFSTVMMLKSFTKAAGQLGLTQSAVSHAVSSLEHDLGFALINRDRSGITVTREGRILLPSINAVLQMDKNVHQEASAILGIKKGVVTVGVFNSISRHLLPKIIHEMDQRYPLVQVRLYEGNYETIEQRLTRGELDCGFVNKLEIKSFQITSLKKDRILCIVSPQSKLYHQKTVSFDQLRKQPFIMPAFGGNHEVKQLLAAHHCKPEIRFELMEENAILAMVRNHLGISILPELVLPDHIAPLKAIPFSEESFRTIGLATRIPPSPAAKCFAEITKELITKLS
ncbi:LysR family transcriptional regulator [Sporolactobacillus terrae]|uniref:LysR family transcriptional regulator n=1 Tax=Sporolactobacillus terrae TaxID=269673 RepID=A0A410D9C3_9BACL|nr:LysR family transcriptional regulator [Sporolactobacillus terrae]QAA22680.1 LysR family transcriptional regulator [Sporolactobacillus terrae]QAA25653.1 LysR family transcriptional regulator [Sporolactobacillus terrae]UAK17465.1 LysR family transcriptional regulator [Sporolactobacillus terrae]BBN99011.1 LysR family transcriptional regulator [Sporolactobacillus terrae]